MLHSKLQGHRSIGSGGDDFLKVFTIYGHGDHLDHVTKLICINFHLPITFYVRFDSKCLRKTSFDFKI